MTDLANLPTERQPLGIYDLFGKRLLDLIGAVVLSILTVPLMIIALPMIAIAFRSNPIVTSKRTGRGGKEFSLLRMRTAPPDGSSATTRRLGEFFRRSSLDELPQLWNVVAGKMSLVGPRPLPPEVSKSLEEWQLRRHLVRPGMTGLWQVEARGDGRALLDNLHYDVQYLDQLSLTTDLRILAKTAAVVLSRREEVVKAELDPPHRLRSRIPHARLIIVDLLTWVLVLGLASVIHAQGGWSAVDLPGLGLAIGTACAGQLLWGYKVGLYRGRWQLASYEEVGWLVAGTTGIALMLGIEILIASSGPIPFGVVFTASGFQIVGALGARNMARALYTAQGRSLHRRPHRLIVFGAGEAGLKAANSVWADPHSDSIPVAFLDDDPAKHGSRPLGLTVLGGRESIGSAAYRYNADLLLIAMPSATGTAVRDIADIGHRAGLDVRILPRLSEYVLTDGEVRVADIRELSLADFLPREELNLDLEGIAGYLTGKRVLVTGAGGSIGSVLCQIIERFEPKILHKLDIDENALHGLQLALEGRALLDSEELILCDIRDRAALFNAFEQAQPEVVFHAAARKHVSFLEMYPAEAVKTNVFGTLNVMEAALKVAAERVVNVSTDKAADPVNILGLTKRVAEMIASHFADSDATAFMSVRFGNVLGSQGSVIPTFREQILNGEPITVTDPDVTRYFMTIDEACQLVLQAGALGGAGDVFVLEMGEPVRIVDLAQRLQRQLDPSRPPNILFTGLRPGEKLHEVLAAPHEVLVGEPHPLLNRYRVPPLSPRQLAGLPIDGEGSALRTALESLVGDHPV